MGCLTATYRRIGSMTATLEKVGGRLVCYAGRIPEGFGGSFDKSFDWSFERIYQPSFDRSFDLSFAVPYIRLAGWFDRVGTGLVCTARRKGALEVSIALVCDTGLTQYVRVEPEYIWLVPELDFTADTEVFSNVDWNINN